MALTLPSTYRADPTTLQTKEVTKEVNPYAKGLEPLCEARVAVPLGKRVLLKAISRFDYAVGNAKALSNGVATDLTKAVCHEVWMVGSEVTKVVQGQHVLHISTASDAADFDKFEKGESKFLYCHEDDIVSHWSLEDAMKIFE